jgi:hypothetical protein
MADRPELIEHLHAGRQDAAIMLLHQSYPVTAATGDRSAQAALAAAVKLFDGDVEQTARWMTARSVHLGATPLECAERSDEGLDQVLRMIAQLERGIYL